MKIGELAKRGNVSAKALRLYHDMDLLKPERIDESGHRVYSDSSLEKLIKIQSLKKIGFSLFEIQGFLNKKVPKLEHALELQEAKIRDEIENKKYELHRIEVAKKIINESADIETMVEAISRLSKAEKYFSLDEIKKVEFINKNDLEIKDLINEKSNWYEGIQKAFKSNTPIDDPEVQVMASKWQKYASYWKNKHPEIAQKSKNMNQNSSKNQSSILFNSDFQLYVKRAIDLLGR